MKKTYHIVQRDAESSSAILEQFSKANGQILLPMVELITQARIAVDELIGEMGRKTVETILQLSAAEVAGLHLGPRLFDLSRHIGPRHYPANAAVGPDPGLACDRDRRRAAQSSPLNAEPFAPDARFALMCVSPR